MISLFDHVRREASGVVLPPSGHKSLGGYHRLPKRIEDLGVIAEVPTLCPNFAKVNSFYHGAVDGPSSV